MPLQIQIFLNGPGDSTCSFPKSGLIAGRLHRQDMISLAIQNKIATRSQLSLLSDELIILLCKAGQCITWRSEPLSGIGMSQSMGYLVASIRTHKQSEIDQLSQAAVCILSCDLQSSSDNLGLKWLQGENASQAQATLRLVTHLQEAVLYQKRNALMLPLSQIKSFQGRFFQPYQIIIGKLASMSHIAAPQEDGKREAAQEIANASTGLAVRCHWAGPGLQKLSRFVQRQRKQVAEICRCVGVAPGCYEHPAAASYGQNIAKVACRFCTIQDYQRLPSIQCLSGGL